MKTLGYGGSRAGANSNGDAAISIVDNELGVFAVCEGRSLTGSAATVAEIALDAAVSLISSPKRTTSEENVVKSTLLQVRAALRHACRTVYRAAHERPELRGMTASMTLVVVIDNRAVVGHVGDTRLFLTRDDTFSQMTHDHTVAGDPAALARGDHFAERDDGVGSKGTNHGAALTRALGAQEDVAVDAFHFEILPGDKILLTTAGLSAVYAAAQSMAKAMLLAENAEAVPARLIYIQSSAQDSVRPLSLVFLSTEVEETHADAEAQRRDEAVLRIDSVRKVFLFRDLELDELLDIADRLVLIVSREGDVVFKEGVPGDAMYVIVDGRCKLSKKKKVIAELGAGAHFGEMSLLSDTPRSATVTVSDRAKLLRISSADFQEISLTRPATGVKLLSALGRELSRRLAASNDRMLYSAKSVPGQN